MDRENGGVRTVLTAVDFHASSREAVRWVTRHFAPGATHHLVHVVDVPELPQALERLVGLRERNAAAREAARRHLQAMLERESVGTVVPHVRQGRPAQEIVALAEEIGADLLVVGEQGPVHGVAAVLGSTAERVLFDAPVPVLVARKTGDAPPLRLLAAIDDSPAADPVLAWTAALLAHPDARATVLNVVDRRLLAGELVGAPEASALRRLEEEARGAMREWLSDRIRAVGLHDAQTETRVVLGDPAYEIIAAAAAARADLVLVGSRGGDVARTPLIGRIINKVVRSASCSVLVTTGAGRREAR